MARFLFCSLASHGYVQPMIGIAHALRARGHEAAFVTGPAFGDLLAAEGFARVPRGAGDGESFEVPLWFDPLAAAMQVKHVEYALERFAPDVIVGQQLTHGPLIAGERARLPVALLGFAAYLWPRITLEGRDPAGDAEKREAWRFEGMLEALNRVRRAFRMEPLERDYVASPMLGDLFMAQSVPEFEGDVETLPPVVHLVGSCLWEPSGPDAELERWLAKRDADAPLLYVHQGRTFDVPSFWRAVVDACRNRGLAVVAAVGRMDGVVGEIPETMLVRAHVEQGAVLPFASAAVSGGNTTAVLGAVTAGVPLVLVPAGNEQPDLAERCARLGTAIVRSPHDLDTAAVTEAIDAVITRAELRAAARELQTAFSRVSGHECAAGLLERLAATHGPIHRTESSLAAAGSASA